MTSPDFRRWRVAILGSGQGTNARALWQAMQTDQVPAQLVLVLSDRSSCGLLSWAQSSGLPCESLPPGRESPPSPGSACGPRESALLASLAAHRIDVLLLAGYMRLLSPAFLARFSRPTLNIHPSLLPAYPGLHAVERQWADGVHESGATVHLVDEGLDTGPVILQGRIRVRGEEGVAGLRSRIQQEVEHIIYPAALCMLLAGLPQST